MMQQTPNRSPVTEYLRGEATGVDDPTLKAEIEQITDWFNRGYNRMATKKQGANVFCSLHLGQTPETPETGARVEIDTSILKLGGMGSEAFAALHSRWQKSRKVDPDAKKPVTQRFWGLIWNTDIRANGPRGLWIQNPEPERLMGEQQPLRPRYLHATPSSKSEARADQRRWWG